MIVSKKTPSSRSCAATSYAQLAKPSPPSGWSEAPAGIAYGLPPPASISAQRPLPALLEADAEPGADQPHVRAGEPAEQDVADLVVDRVRPVDPALLHQHAASGRRGRRPPPPGGCGWTAPHRSTPACRSPWRARRRPGTPACGSCCRRTRCRSCSPPAWPRSTRRRGAGSAVRADAPATDRTAAGSARTTRSTWEHATACARPAGDEDCPGRTACRPSRRTARRHRSRPRPPAGTPRPRCRCAAPTCRGAPRTHAGT